MKKIPLLLICLSFFSNIAIAQTKEEKKQLKEENAEKEYSALKELVNSKKYVFYSEWLRSSGGLRINNAGGSDVIEIKNDSARGSLRYFGTVTSISSSREGGVVFDNLINKYSIKYNDKKRRINVFFTIKNKSENYDVSLTLQNNGDAYVDVFSNIKSNISYEGKIKPLLNN